MASGFRAVGAHPEFALELPAALIAAGLRDVNAELTSRLIYGGTEESAFYALTLRQIGPTGYLLALWPTGKHATTYG